ncbi:MAG: hypothetical protein CVU09_00440 [Bacteroidetes bacterium HGW-Bacteroidetes-4]|jgi:transcriptional regulator with XRE-family HTH domain|nr:MAG: hypothetical protein CVU09_00440 [Bacteroidetes bacterium HGW-Bacteroidetes-4]
MIDLKKFRKDNKIKQSTICEILGVAQPYISAIESGKRPLSEDKFNLLYKHFGDILLKYRKPDFIDILKKESNKTYPDFTPLLHELREQSVVYESKDDKIALINTLKRQLEDKDTIIELLRNENDLLREKLGLINKQTG